MNALNAVAVSLVLSVWLGSAVAIDRRRKPRPARPLADTIRGADVRCGDVIGLGDGLGLTVERTVFDGEDGLLIGRASCAEPIDNGRHGVLRPGQPYAAVVTASGELSWLTSIKAGF